MKKFLQNVSCASSCLKKEEFSQNKEGNIKAITNSQRTKDTDIYSLFGHPPSPCHSARFGHNIQIQSQNKRTANWAASTSERTSNKENGVYCPLSFLLFSIDWFFLILEINNSWINNHVLHSHRFHADFFFCSLFICYWSAINAHLYKRTLSKETLIKLFLSI